jgi:TonB family protein
MSASLTLSAALHVILIYGYSLPPGRGTDARLTVIHARLSPAQSPAIPQRAKTAGRKQAPDSSGFAPVVLAPPAPNPVTETPTAPDPMVVPDDPEPATAAAGHAPGTIVPDTVHYPAKDLDTYPQASRRITPDYPRSARDAQIAGSVTLLVMIDETGRVEGTSVIDAVPDGVFEQAAQQALANAAFYPAQKDGCTVRSRILVKVEFDPAAAQAAQ